MAQKPPARGKKGDPLIGAVVERRWRIIDQIGSGGMGAVYRAERIHLGKQVALKFLHASQLDSKSTVARFEREAKAVSRLHHVNCVSILDFGVYRKQPYIVMEYVEGRQLTELDPDTLTPSKGVSIMRQMLMGLAHAHGRGVIHRDLKLSNVMLVEMTGTEELVKLLDFGLARLVGGGVDVEKSLTHEGFVAGTPTYMSPEQCLGKTVDQRSDLYSAGVVLYTLCTGKRPFHAEDTAVLLHKQIHEAPVPPRRMAPQKRISEPLERVILRAMEKKPDDRFQTALDFLRALDDTPEGQATQTPTVAHIRAPRSRRRLLLFGALVCVVLGGAGALYIRSYVIALRQKVGTLPVFQHWSHQPDGGATAAATSAATRAETCLGRCRSDEGAAARRRGDHPRGQRARAAARAGERGESGAAPTTDGGDRHGVPRQGRSAHEKRRPRHRNQPATRSSRRSMGAPATGQHLCVPALA
jgi:tRNA A-37 threonylcarbamoyl transferase component Bud32